MELSDMSPAQKQDLQQRLDDLIAPLAPCYKVLLVRICESCDCKTPVMFSHHPIDRIADKMDDASGGPRDR